MTFAHMISIKPDVCHKFICWLKHLSNNVVLKISVYRGIGNEQLTEDGWLFGHHQTYVARLIEYD